MAGTTRGDGDLGGVEFVRESDGSVTAMDLDTGLARGGEPISLRELAGTLPDEGAETFRTGTAESYRNTKE